MIEEFKIKELKEALTEVSKLCFNRLACTQDCPFYVMKWGGCPMKYTNFPEEWDVRVWEENENDQTD